MVKDLLVSVGTFKGVDVSLLPFVLGLWGLLRSTDRVGLRTNYRNKQYWN